MCTLASLLSQLVFLRYFVAGTGFEPVTSRLWALQATSALPHNLFVQEAGFAPARFSCLSINLWRGHVCLSLSPLRFELFHHSCVFNLQYVKELSKFGCFELVFIVSKYTVLFPFSDTIFLWTRAVLPGGLAQAFDWIIHRLSLVLLNWQTSQFPYFSSSVYWELIFCTLLG